MLNKHNDKGIVVYIHLNFWCIKIRRTPVGFIRKPYGWHNFVFEIKRQLNTPSLGIFLNLTHSKLRK